MSNELVPQIEGGSLEEFTATCAGSDYLPRFKLFGSKSDAVAEGKILPGHWGLDVDGEITDLGPEVELVIVTWRTTAIQTSPDFVICHDSKSRVYDGIKAMSTVKDSGCMYDPEFLVWIPEVSTFATLHMNSKTARREAKKIGPLIGKAATFKCKLIDPPGSKYKWHGPVVIPCSSPLTVPDAAVVVGEAEKFRNPVAPEPEAAPEDDGRAR